MDSFSSIYFKGLGWHTFGILAFGSLRQYYHIVETSLSHINEFQAKLGFKIGPCIKNQQAKEKVECGTNPFVYFLINVKKAIQSPLSQEKREALVQYCGLRDSL